MRISTLLLALVAAVALAACTGKSNTQSNTGGSGNMNSGTAAAPSSAPASATSDAIPNYPGATQMASGTSSGAGVTSASGTVLSTSDSFDTVYHWYQSHMPAGSEKSHSDMGGMESAVFYLGNAGGDQRSVTITTSGGKTMITIAHVTQ